MENEKPEGTEAAEQQPAAIEPAAEATGPKEPPAEDPRPEAPPVEEPEPSPPPAKDPEPTAQAAADDAAAPAEAAAADEPPPAEAAADPAVEAAPELPPEPAIIPEHEPPHIEALSPAHGPVRGGTRVEIVGVHFAEGAVVRFGDTDAPTTFESDTLLVATTPERPSFGFADVRVTNPDGKSEVRVHGYNYDVPPLPEFVKPDTHARSGESWVTAGAGAERYSNAASRTMVRPSRLVTRREPVPGSWAGAVKKSFLSESKVTCGARVPKRVTVQPRVKFLPATVTRVPPVGGP